MEENKYLGNYKEPPCYNHPQYDPSRYPADLSVHQVDELDEDHIYYVINIERKNFKEFLKATLFDKATEFCLENKLELTALRFSRSEEMISCFFMTEKQFTAFDEFLSSWGWVKPTLEQVQQREEEKLL